MLAVVESEERQADIKSTHIEKESDAIPETAPANELTNKQQAEKKET